MTGTKAASGSGGDPEYRVKALFLYKMIHWVQWPATNLPESAKTVTVGVVGEDPFGKELDVIEKLKPIKGRSVKVVRFAAIADVKDCQMLFLSGSLTESDEKAILSRAAQEGFLTVADSRGFIDRGGAFGLLIVKDKLVFEVSTKATDAADIKVSAQLLKLARRVLGEED